MSTPAFALTEQVIRHDLATFLYCEAFELRDSPEIARVVSGLAARVESDEPIADMLANSGATGQGSPYAALRKPDALRALAKRRALTGLARALRRLIGIDL